MVRKNRILLYILLVLLPFAFPSCESEPARIEVVEKGDYSVLLEAVRSSEQSLSAKLALVAKAALEGLASDAQVIQLIQEMMKSLEGTLEEKLSAIEEAVKAQTTDLEAKLALIEAAVQGGLADAQTQQALIQQALESLSGTVEQKLAAIEEAVKARGTTLETRLALIEKAVKEGLADQNSQEELLAAALESLDGTTQEKLETIQSAMSSEMLDLETKIGLLVAALEKGYGDVSTTLENLQKALDASLQGMDKDLEQVKTSILEQLKAISGQLTPTELSKAFKDVMDALDGQDKGAGEILKSLQKTVEELQAQVGEVTIKELVYMGHPTEPATVSCGQDLELNIQVNPSHATLTQDMLTMECINSKQFFLSGTDRSKAVKDHYTSFTLQAHPEEKGLYTLKVKTLVDQTYKYWDESSLVFKTKDVSTQAIPVSIMPNPQDGLSLSPSEKTATFLYKDTLGVVYQPLTSIQFTDGKQSRTYTPEFLKSAHFSSTSLAAKTALDRDLRFVSICPDTLDTGWMTLADSTHVDHKEIGGTLVLTDRWGSTANYSLSKLQWYTSYISTVIANPKIENDTVVADLRSQAAALGLNTSDCPGSKFCKVEKFEFASASGAWLSAQFDNDSWKLNMQLLSYPSGSRFTLDVVVVQVVQPSEVDSSFLPTQRKVRIRVDFTVK